MTRAPNIVDRLAEIDLRILMRLYDAGQEPIDFRFDDIATFPPSDVDRNEVDVQLRKLKAGAWIKGDPGSEGFLNAALEQETFVRLNLIIPGAIIKNIQWVWYVLHNCDADNREGNLARQVRDGLLQTIDDIQFENRRPDRASPRDDDFAELRLRALMAILDSPTHPEFGEVRSFRDEVPSHIGPAVELAIQDAIRRFGAPDGGIGVTPRTNAVLGQRVYPDGLLWAEAIRRALTAADKGEVVPGRFAEIWQDLCDRMG